MSRDYDNGRAAIEVLTRDIKDHAEKQGKEMTHASAEAEAKKIADRAEKRVEQKR